MRSTSPLFIELYSSYETKVPLYVWQPEIPIRGWVHISHGMGEHALRYQRLAHQLNQSGLVVYAHDHRGHGRHVNVQKTGHFSDHHGWKKAVADIQCCIEFAQQKHSNLPCFVLGHSMGSYLLQSTLMHQTPPHLSGLILSGSNYVQKPLLWCGRFIATLEVWRQGKTGVSRLIQHLTFSDFNRRFQPQRTDFDWLSRDQDEVDAYRNDPLCGFPCTNQLWSDLFHGLSTITSVAAINHIQQNIPVLILGGTEDPVSAPNRLNKLASAYQKSGKAVTTHIYSGGRHEMFNEINAEQVIKRLIQWMHHCLKD